MPFSWQVIFTLMLPLTLYPREAKMTKWECEYNSSERMSCYCKLKIFVEFTMNLVDQCRNLEDLMIVS